MSTLVPSGARPRESKNQNSTGSCSRSHDTRPVLHLGPDLLCASRALCPYAPGEPSTHSPVGTRSFPAPTSDESIVRQTTGLRLPRYSLASREGGCQWRSHGHGGGSTGRRPGDHGTQRPDGSPQVAPSSAQGQLPITNCWARNQGQSRCRIAKPETSHNAEPQPRQSRC